MKIFNSLLIACIANLMFASGLVALDTNQFADPVLQKRYQKLTEELRCLVCQNETISGSSAPLALDLRNQVAAQIKSGKSDKEIRSYMTERYGEFIHYRPPDSGATRLLWLAPLVLLIGIGLIFYTIINKRSALTDSGDRE